ncbi:uncharacterized protein TRAVEDRAFT_48578 [Trametes versicolor FP-101664 SS1]|uniref:uncharacterized protein n=1 Tax=Trametes versicolor (strain FP-101664) TaxID=717944 RepID=UPI0004623BD2|nr:uncharacterized protein TRAVEDRAFT_48578 [Trametes versicolor FP-101664 SS1]EIW57540.1 hypothetical protein TRAVEDRAFT_48578 [Trametes versicolor FP-101664 SS1]
MSPSTKPERVLKVRVPRHNSQRIGPVLTSHVETVAHNERTRADVRQTALEPTSALAQAIESASDWNSLLLTARAARGPQWDVGTQQWFVDERSELYYDPTPLLEYQKEYQQNNSDEPSSSSRQSQRQQQQQDSVNSPRMHRGSMPPGGMTPSMSHSQLYGQQQQMASPRHPYPGPNQGMGGPYGGMAPIPPAQFYGGDGVPPSPISRGPGPGMGMSPGMGMGQGMGMNPGMGMGGMDGSLSPEVRRRVTRGMSMDEFGNMH